MLKNCLNPWRNSDDLYVFIKVKEEGYALIHMLRNT